MSCMSLKKKCGFSMIEVLIAATILIIIVLMLGALFQQSSTAWRTGMMRTGGYMQLRSYIGTLQRDASAMINANLLPKNMLCGGQEQSFSTGELRFYTVSGSDQTRTLNYITYSLNGKRTQQVMSLTQGGSTGSAAWESSKTTELLKFMPNQSDDNMAVNPTTFRVTFPPSSIAYTEYDRDGQTVSGNRRFPLFVTVEAQVKQKGSLYDVGAESAGPDKQWGTKDDIRTFIDTH